jgi:hypothetical protein
MINCCSRSPETGLLQDTGTKLLKKLQDADFENSEELEFLPRPAWVYTHDCQRHTYSQFNQVVRAFKEQRAYISTYIPLKPTFGPVDEDKLAKHIEVTKSAAHHRTRTYWLLNVSIKSPNTALNRF